MGLDNGIIIKNMTEQQIEHIPPYIQTQIIKHNNKEVVDIAYWRKCWGIRSLIINILHMNSNCEEQIDVEDIPPIIKGLCKFLSKEYWDTEGDSIWEYEEIQQTLIQNIINLKWLYYFMQKNKNIKVEFYDSY